MTLQLHLPKDEEVAFLKACAASISNDNKDAAIEAVLGIDCSKAKASEPQDQAMIQEALAARGTAYVNRRLRDELRLWCYTLCVEGMPALVEAAKLKEEWKEASDLQWAIGRSLDISHGDPEQALSAFEQAMELLHRVSGYSKCDEATLLGYIGACQTAMGHAREALESHERALGICKSLGQEDTIDAAAIYSNIGRVYETQGQHAKALEYHLKDLKITLAVLGEKHATRQLATIVLEGFTMCKGSMPRRWSITLKA